MRAVTAAQMRAIDAAAVAAAGEVALMRGAGAAAASLVERYAVSGPIVGIAGNGNNGGDAFATLASVDASRRRVVYEKPGIEGSAARADARSRAVDAGVEIRPFPPDPHVLHDAGLVLDGVLGVNARLPLDHASAQLVRAMNAAAAPILALDIPTGIDPTSGTTGDDIVRAVATISFGRPKRGTFLEPARGACGDLWCATLGMRDEDADGIDDPSYVMTDAEFASLLPVRPQASEKRSAGAPLIIAGSAQFPGAAILATMGAARAGAGYVTLAAPEAAAAALRAHLVEQVVVTFDERSPEEAIETILDLTNRCSSIGMGPGLPLADPMGIILRTVIERTSLPIVADASAFFHLTKRLDLLRGKPIVLTPHAGEFGRLSGKGTVAPNERWPRLRAFVQEHGITTLLKGDITLIADSETTHINPTGTPALATAGTGDVLTGVISTLLAQGLSLIDAACAGAYWHGRAGRVAAQRRRIGVIAGDVYDALAEAAETTYLTEPFRIT